MIADTRHIRQKYAVGRTPYGPAVSVDPECVFLVGPALQNSAGEATLNAKSGDVISITGTSTDHNSSDAVIVYKVLHGSHGTALGRFAQHAVTRNGAVEPDPNAASRDGLPALETTANFSSFESTILSRGTEKIRIEFALYSPSANGQRQMLVGYYGFDLSLTVT